MIGAVEISQERRLQLRKIKRLRGITGFCKKAQINYRTFDRLIKEGNAKADIVDRVQAALDTTIQSKTATPEVVRTMVCTGYGITQEALQNVTRYPMLAEARQVC